jgi:hypothetical protein
MISVGLSRGGITPKNGNAGTAAARPVRRRSSTDADERAVLRFGNKAMTILAAS